MTPPDHEVHLAKAAQAMELLAEVEAVLSRTPATLSTLLDRLPEALLTSGVGENTFSPLDVRGHLIHGENTDWLPRVDLILSAGGAKPFLPSHRLGFQEAIRGRSAKALAGGVPDRAELEPHLPAGAFPTARSALLARPPS